MPGNTRTSDRQTGSYGLKWEFNGNLDRNNLPAPLPHALLKVDRFPSATSSPRDITLSTGCAA